MDSEEVFNALRLLADQLRAAEADVERLRRERDDLWWTATYELDNPLTRDELAEASDVTRPLVIRHLQAMEDVA